MKRKMVIAQLPIFAVLLASIAWGGNSGNVHYKVIDLGNPLHGTISQGSSINDLGWIAGTSHTAGNAASHAELWRHDLPPLDLGTLGGPNSAVGWPNHNDGGIVVGISETPDLQRFGENWSCAIAVFNDTPPSEHICLGFKWQNGVMTKLSTLGGDNSFAAGVNNSGDVVGWAETSKHDSTCVPPQVMQFLPVIWGPDGHSHVLHPLPGDQDGAATGINERGQVIGISGKCDMAVGRFSAEHAVMWDRDAVIDLGNIGGNSWNTPMDVNSRGEVVGFADLPGDPTGNSPNFHAFLWTRKHGMVDLGTLPGDAISEALGINDKGQIVGVSFGAGFSHPNAVIWEDGQILDLNNLLPAGSGLHLNVAQAINDRGEITGAGTNPPSVNPAFLLIPQNGEK